MNYKAEANAIHIEVDKLGKLIGFLDEQRKKANLGDIDTHTPVGAMVRDHDVLLAQLVAAQTSLAMTTRDLLLRLAAEPSAD
jgi:hypothetical protein